MVYLRFGPVFKVVPEDSGKDSPEKRCSGTELLRHERGFPCAVGACLGNAHCCKQSKQVTAY